MYILFIGFILGLSFEPVTRLFDRDIDKEFIFYVDNFETVYGKKVSTSIQFADRKEEENWVGRCYEFTNYVEIDRTYWNKMGIYEREELIFHELGHCELGLEHDDTIEENNCPRSIMYPYIFSRCYRENRANYIKELFDKTDNI